MESKILYKLNKEYKATGNETLTIDGTVKHLTVPEDAIYAIIYVESDNLTDHVLRYWEDGSSPTTTTGIPRHSDTAFDVENKHNLLRFRVTETSANTTKIQVQYYA